MKGPVEHSCRPRVEDFKLGRPIAQYKVVPGSDCQRYNTRQHHALRGDFTKHFFPRHVVIQAKVTNIFPTRREAPVRFLRARVLRQQQAECVVIGRRLCRGGIVRRNKEAIHQPCFKSLGRQ
jgi:hypothetical protein